MRSIILSTGAEYGTNNHDGGVFLRKSDGTWQQLAGNSQTPYFRTRKQFRRYLREHFDVRNARRVDSFWAI